MTNHPNRSQNKPHFVFVPAEDESVDSEYQLIRADGTAANISIQDCRSYGRGSWTVNKYEGEGDQFTMTEIGVSRSLEIAKKIALANLDK